VEQRRTEGDVIPFDSGETKGKQQSLENLPSSPSLPSCYKNIPSSHRMIIIIIIILLVIQKKSRSKPKPRASSSSPRKRNSKNSPPPSLSTQTHARTLIFSSFFYCFFLSCLCYSRPPVPLACFGLVTRKIRRVVHQAATMPVVKKICPPPPPRGASAPSPPGTRRSRWRGTGTPCCRRRARRGT